jgi:osmoprotectant transport system permease protein
LRIWLAFLIVLMLTPMVFAQELTVGSKRFTESYILGEIIRQTAAATEEAKATHKKGLGNTGIVFSALKSGSIDVYPEYVGTLDKEILKNKAPADIATLNQQLAASGLGIAVPLGFNDTYALAMREEKAEKLGIRTLSDLTKHPELKLALSQEFLGRADGWAGLQKAYGLPFATPRGIDHGLSYEAMAQGQIDITDIYTTDAKIDRYKLRVLTDDRKFFPSYEAVLLYRLDLPKRLPKTWVALQELKGKISEKQMIAMNAEAELEGKSFATIAARFLNKATNTPTAADEQQPFLSKLFGDDFWKLTTEHIMLVSISLAFGVLVGVPLGIWAVRVPQAAQPILSMVGVIQTIPSLALLAFLIPLFQIGTPSALVALFLYALLPIVRNTYTGLSDIPSSLKESALALGLPSLARLRLVELPLAARTILAGIKTSAIINVGTATIAAFIGAGGYGERIASGLALNDNATLLAGAIPAAGLALLVQFGFDLLDRWLIPAGLQAKSSSIVTN